MSLRARLFLLTLLIVVPALATAWLALQTTYTRERVAIERTLRETTRALSLVIDRELGMREAVAWSLAGSPSLASGDLHAFHAQASAATRHLGGWAVLVDEQRGGQLLNTLKEFDEPLPDSVGPRLLPERRSGTAAVSDLFMGPVADRPIIAVSVPVPIADKGARTYGLSLILEPERLQKVMEEQGLPPRWTAAIIDRGGHIVARQPSPQRWIGRLATEDVRRRIATGTEGLFASRTLDGEPVTTYFSRSPVHGWTFIIGVPDAVIGASLRRSVLETGLMTALLSTFAVGIAVFWFRRISAHVRSLQTTARLLENGKAVVYGTSGVPELDAIGNTLVSAGRRIGDANQHLEQQVAKAVDEVRRAQERLAESQRLEALGRLTGGVAHDVNNLLAVVTNNVFVLQRLLGESHGAQQLAAIRRAVDTGRQLTQKLLAFSRRRAMQPQVVDLSTWLPLAAPLVHSSVAPGVDVQMEVAPDLPPIEVDPIELELALVNLTVNASDAMPGGGRLSIRVRRSPPDRASDRDRVRIEVADTGEGIEPELLDKVFEPFFTTKDVSKGSGLGLSQVYGFCTQSGGSVGIDSAPGRGTTVTMVLPTASGARATAPDAPDALAKPMPSGGRVLYVEDNEEVGRATADALQSLGHEVQWSPDAADALRRLDRERFDIVLSDIVMPGEINGLKLAMQLRKTKPQMPVMLMTGYSDELDAAIAAGFEVMQKPCPPEVLAAALGSRIERIRTGADAVPDLE